MGNIGIIVGLYRIVQVLLIPMIYLPTPPYAPVRACGLWVSLPASSLALT